MRCNVKTSRNHRSSNFYYRDGDQAGREAAKGAFKWPRKGVQPSFVSTPRSTDHKRLTQSVV